MKKSKAQQLDRPAPAVTIGRYVLHREIARGGMATIHFARLLGDEGFNRIVAAKRLHPALVQDEQFVAMFRDEARIASRVQHRNVVPVLDVVTADHEVILVQEYVHGVPLDTLIRSMKQRKRRVPVPVSIAIACQVLAGLQATHDTTDELGKPMRIVHRDVSPQNVMIALDGSARLLDFGIAQAGTAQATPERTYKGKLAYSAPEQLLRAASPQSDIYSASVLLWELLVGERMHERKSEPELVAIVMGGTLPSMQQVLAEAHGWSTLSQAEREQLVALEPVVRKGLCGDLAGRWATARDMEQALEAAVAPAPSNVLGEWAETTGKAFLERRAAILASEEESWRRLRAQEFTRAESFGSDGQRAVGPMRTSIPPEAVAPIAGSFAHRFSMGRVLSVLGGSVVLGSALALMVPAAPESQSRAGALEKERAKSPPGLLAGADDSAGTPVSTALVVPPLALPARNTESARAARPISLATVGANRRLPLLPAATRAAAAGASGRTSPNLTPPRGTPPFPRPSTNTASAGAGSAVSAAKLTTACDVPYYYEGKKKIFKRDCI